MKTHIICRHSHNLRLADLWMLPLTMHSPTALLAAAFCNISSYPAIFDSIRDMAKSDMVLKWIFVPSYPLLVVSIDLLSQSRFYWILVLHFGANYCIELLLVTQLLWTYFVIGTQKHTMRNLLDQSIDHFLARLPRAFVVFAFSYFCFYCLWFMLHHSLIRAPM